MEVKNILKGSSAKPADVKVETSAISAVPKKQSRLPITEVTQMLVSAGAAGTTVPLMAAALAKVSSYVPGAHGAERDVRLVIDRLRAQKHRIVRSALKNFTYLGGPEATAAK